MKEIFQRSFQALLLIAIVALLFYSYQNNAVRQLDLYLVVHALLLVYHLLFDGVKSRLLIWVFSLFVASTIMGVIYAHITPKHNFYVYAIHSIYFIGLLLIFVEMLKRNPPRLVINKYSVIIVLVLVMDVYFGYKIVQLVDKYQLSLEHLFFGFIYTIFKMILMSAGFIFYLTSGRKSRKISFLNWSFIAFFLSDIISTLNTVIFMMDPIKGIIVIQNGLLCLALFFFYMYCTSPDIMDVLEEERFL